MAARTWLLAFAMAALSFSAGCRSYCERVYGYPPQCYPPPYSGGYGAPACPPAPAAYPAPAGAYAPPTGELKCTCVPAR